MFDKEADETFVGAERRGMNAKRDSLGVIAVLVAQVESARLGEVDLIGGDGELAPDCTPNLDVNLWPIEGSFVRHFDIVDARPLQDITGHLFGLLPKLRLIDKFLPELRWIV